MGMYASVDIFQSKADEMLGDIEGIKTYINYINLLIKNFFTNHMEQLSKIFNILRSLKGFDIKPILTTIKNTQANGPVERVHQVIFNILVTKNIDNKFFEYIDPWDETLASIPWAIRVSYQSNVMVTPGQAVFARDIIFSLASVVEWRVITASKQRQVDIDSVRENVRLITYDYEICDQFYVEMGGIYHKLYYH